MADFTRPYRIGALLLDCVCAKLALTPSGCPDRRCLVPGIEPSVENCCDGKNGGQLTVNIIRTYPSRNFPVPNIAAVNCDDPWSVTTYGIQVWRCVTAGDIHHPPNCSALDDTALKTWTDMEAMRQGVACCLRDRSSKESVIGIGYEWNLGDHTTLGPEGGCVGSNLLVQVGIPTCWDCA